MRSLSLFLMLFLLSLRVYGEVEQYYNSLLGSEIAPGASMMVTESYYGINNGTLYDVESSVGVVKLRHDYTSHSLFLPSPFFPGALQLPVIEVTVDITWTDISGGVHQIQDEVLEIEVASVATDLVRIEGAHRLEVQVKQVSSGVLTLQPGMHVFLESEIEVHRHFRLPGSDVQHPLPAIEGSDYELSLSVSDGSVGDFRWQYQIGAAYYELEWVVLDDAFGLVSDNLDNREVDFSRASRLQVKEANYRLSLAYPRSVLAYRVRAVYLSGPQGMGEKHYAVWSTDGLASVGENRFELNQAGVEYHQNYAGLDLDRNWAFVRSYAEWGKSKEVIQYADGTSRVRQVVTRLSTEEETLVGETMYDFEGRPVVEFAPVPSGQSTLEFHEAFNLDGNQEVFGPEDFDVAGGINSDAYHQPTVWTGSGAANYYSAQNPFLSGLPPALQGRDYEQHFLPDAEGLPYRRTIYTDDGTGRVKMTSGLGGTHDIKAPDDLGGRQTTYYYTSANEVELRRLFGTEVGDPSQYVKELVKDANGQLSVAYKRVDGKVVATALTGDAPSNLNAIPQPEDSISFLAEIQPPSGTAEEDVQTISIPYTQAPIPALTYQFAYTLTGSSLGGCENFCATCSYELEFALYDPEGDVVPIDVVAPLPAGISVNLGSAPSISFTVEGLNCTTLAALSPALSFEASLSMVGNYSLVRKLRLHQAQVDQALADYALHYPANCAPIIGSTVDTTDCDPACLSAAEAAMALETPAIPAGEQADWLAQWMYENCLDASDTLPDPIGSPVGQSPCEGDCAQLLSVLETDVSPGGQYYQDDQWLLDHMSSWSVAVYNLYNLSPSDYRAGFDNLSATDQQSVIDLMVVSHPEYCHYSWCQLSDILASCEFDSWLMQTVDATNYTSTLSYNGTSVVVDDPVGTDPDRIPLSDPFFATGSIGYPKLGEMEDRLADYPTGNDPLNPATGTVIAVIEDQLADPTDTDDQIDTWAEMEMLLDIYLSLKAGIISELKIADGCGYVYPGGNSPAYLDGKQIRVPDPSVGGLYGGGSLPTGNYPILNGDVAGMCEQNCDTWAQDWRQQLSSCIQWQDTYVGADPPLYSTSTISLAGHVLGTYSQYSWPTDGGTQQTLIDWVVNGGIYNGTTIVGLIDYCQSQCEGPPSDLSGCLESADVAAALTAVFDVLLTVDLSQTIPGESESWLSALTDCFQPVACVDHPYNCDCEVFDLNNYYQSLDSFLTYHGLADPPTSYTTFDGYPIDSDSIVAAWFTACQAGTLQQSELPLELRCHEWELGEEDDDPCGTYLDMVNTFNIEQLTAADLVEAMEEFAGNYEASCWNVSEELKVSYPLREYHYTLYYYDQSGNLIQTIPPEGVTVLSATEVDNLISSCLDQGLTGNACPANPEHSFLTRYQHDSYNAVVGSRTPDGGQSVYVYDELGRERFSQNAQQAPQDSWSYTRYDHLSRKVEVGEFFPTDPQAALEPENANFPDYIHGERRDITYTWYGVNNVRLAGLNNIDDFLNVDPTDPSDDELLVPISVLPLENSLNLRNRVGISARIHSMELFGGNPLVNLGQSTHYVYDVAGNVQELYQLNRDVINILGSGASDPNLLAFENLAKRMSYEYDLVSGNVNAFHYQPGQLDQYHHRYDYDADNRLTHVFTSLDGVIWDQDARYDYYPHGPLARVELGQDLIQGRDSYYTLQGWLKGINSAGLDPANDPGRDGLSVGKYDLPNYHAHFAKDAMGFQLNYYDNATEQDYRPIAASGQVGLPMLAVNGNLASARHDLFNGNIGSMFTGIQDEPSANPPGIVGHGLSGSAYQYDQLNRIVQSQFFDNYNLTSDTWNANAGNHQHFQTSYTYDGNGNLLTLKRSGNLATGGSFDMDQLTYSYDWGTNPVGVAPPPDKLNRLRYVADDPTLSGNYANDIDGTTNFSDSYDLIGRLISHSEEDITSILWDPYQKIRRINFNQAQAPQKPQNLQFFYDGMGNRTLKRALYDGDVIETDRDIRHTWHVHDASGNVVSTYQLQEDYESSTEWYTLEVRQSEVPLYGSSRLGLHLTDRLIQRYFNDDDENGYLFLDGTVPTLATGPITSHNRQVGHKAYELPNHLGNVLATVSDRKWPIFSEPKPGKWQFEHFQAELLSASEYYPFGMEMPGRIASSESYRYGFQGQEKDDEIKGPGNSINYKYRMHDPRMGRFLSVDPLAPKYPFYSPYAFSGNRVIDAVELEGLEPKLKNHNLDSKGETEKTKGEIHISIKVLDLSSENVEHPFSSTENPTDFEQFNSTNGLATKKTVDYEQRPPQTTYKQYEGNVYITINQITSIDEVGENDYLLVLVDKVDAQTYGKDQGGVTVRNTTDRSANRVSFISNLSEDENLLKQNRGFHELAHSLVNTSKHHPDRENLLYGVSFNSFQYLFPEQLGEIWEYATSFYRGEERPYGKITKEDLLGIINKIEERKWIIEFDESKLE